MIAIGLAFNLELYEGISNVGYDSDSADLSLHANTHLDEAGLA